MSLNKIIFYKDFFLTSIAAAGVGCNAVLSLESRCHIRICSGISELLYDHLSKEYANEHNENYYLHIADNGTCVIDCSPLGKLSHPFCTKNVTMSCHSIHQIQC